MLNPYQILDAPETANDEEIRTAYLTQLRNNPPDSNQQQFQQIQQAYDRIKDSDARLRYRLFHIETITSEIIAQFIQPNPVDQRNRRVDLQTLQNVFKMVVAQANSPTSPAIDQ
ncbi:MAG: J domain-containing protein [Methylococcales bacterium]